jgi:hypothetical protein
VAEAVNRRDVIDAHFTDVYSAKTPVNPLHSANPTHYAAVI